MIAKQNVIAHIKALVLINNLKVAYAFKTAVSILNNYTICTPLNFSMTAPYAEWFVVGKGVRSEQ